MTSPGPSTFDPAKVAKQVAWLAAHPEFEEMPATIREFLGSDYLNFTTARPGLVEALVAIFGEEVNAERISNFERAMVTGGIGIGKTTFASIAIPYMVHHTLCLRNPQEFYGLGAGTRIAFMQMSTSAKQAREVVFGDLKARVMNSKWFMDNYVPDPAYENQMRFKGKEIWVLPGGSNETSFEGYNILGGILDEMDSHKIVKEAADGTGKDYADIGFKTIESRISSRFVDFSNIEESGHRGLLICIGQMKKSNGFANRKYKEMLGDKKAYVKRMTIWESFGWEKFTRPDGSRASFWYNIKSKKIVPNLLVTHIDSPDLIEIPNAYRTQFENFPEDALKDLAGIPPATTDPFISLVDRIEECRERWKENHGGSPSPVKPNPTRPEFEDWFRAKNDPRKRVMHIDFALSQDAMGLAMGYVDHLVKVGDKEEKPYIVFDCLIRIKALSGMQIQYNEVRDVIYYLREELGFNLKAVTMDGFQSTDTKQQLRKKKYTVDDLSMDKSTLGYEDLREAIYERRLEFPEYLTYLNKGDTNLVEVAVKELMELSYTGRKVDHLPEGSKDVADAMAGVVTTLMGDRTYRRGVVSTIAQGTLDESQVFQQTGTDGSMGVVLQMPGMGGQVLTAPRPDGGMGLTIPSRLRPRG